MNKKKHELKPKKIKARIVLLKALPYKEVMVYLRKIDEDIFEYLVPFKGEVWTSYLIITPKKGCKTLTKGETNNAAALVFAGATATIDMLLGETKLDKKTEKIVDVFEGAREGVESQSN